MNRAPILLVESDSFDEHREVEALTTPDRKHRVLVARTTQNALTLIKGLAKGAGIAMVYLDEHVPFLGATELLRKIRADKDICDIPVVVMTSRKVDDSEMSHVARDADSWFRRPKNASDLAAVFEKFTEFFARRRSSKCSTRK
ncbi:response regulator [soil metagenome]